LRLSTCQVGEIGRGSTDLAEIHRLDTLGTKSGTDRRTGACLASSDNELDDLVSDLGTTGHFDGWAVEDSVG